MLGNFGIRLLIFGSFVRLGDACLGGAPLGLYPQQYPSYGAPYAPYSAASRTRMASPSHTLTASNSLDELQPLTDCVQRFPNQKLGCIPPFERRAPSSEQECQQMCDEYTSKCRGYQFDSLINECQLFDVDRNGRPKAYDEINYKDDGMDGSYKHRSKRHPNKNPFDEFLRDPLKMMSGEPQLPSIYCEPSLVSAIGTNYVQSDYNCRMSAAIQGPPPSPSYQPKTPTTITKMSVGRSAQVQAPVIVPVQGPDCQDGANARIQLIDGIELVDAKPVVTVQLDSPDACLHVCRLNTHLDGTHFPRPCKSSSFDRSTGRCHIFDSAISPNGDLNYMPNSNSIYFEKFCIPLSELPMGCDDVIHRIPQHTLDRRASGTGAIVTASTQVNCIRQCVSAVLGFECMSASYFFDWPSENCYLSRFTRISRPDIYVAERKQFVDYLEMAKCLNNNWQHDQAPNSWSEWSKCDESLTKTRQRNCTGCKQRKESIPCVSETSYQHDFPKALTETDNEPKNIAANFESARRYKEASKKNIDASAEASLFGEHDYENQKEVSFFGPPLTNSKEERNSDDHVEMENSSNLFKIRSSIRPIQTGPPAHIPPADFSSENRQSKEEAPLEPPFDAPEPGDFASAEIFAKSRFNLANDLNTIPTQQEEKEGQHHKQLSAKRIEPTSEDEHLLLKKALQETESPVESKSEETTSGKLLIVKKVETTTTHLMIGDCDPKIKCCPRPNNQKSARLRGCVIGFRLGSDGHQQIACITEEYCTQASTAENLSRTHKINCTLLVFSWLVALKLV